ncbi:serine-rich coiled-coil domain-containing protein 2-like isoform X1 [Sinocyclocheilus anshuiensis]|uniref:serine-rich coiled-coil domain-containing protein 2-like isoform X1 n=1 Tax=Sinocyclocheilus anshuiensis TaxID=1608454 RepID=UPI0007B78E65|nr:PREDICTED: serine-rich coiled-coil domain-containing protein 2-like isoform X1 [Sinocyclocheilus anshuiensis]
MERKAVKQLNMVSRLPKFASRPSGTTMTNLPQGSALPVSSSESKGVPLGRHNNLTHLQSLNWRKDEEDIGNKVQHTDSLDEETSVTIKSRSPMMVNKKPSPAAAVKCKSAVLTSQSSCPRSIPQPSKIRMTTPKRLSTWNPLYNDMATQNGVSGGNGRCGSSGPSVGHVPQQRTLQSKLSLSNDSIKSASKEIFTHSKRVACSTNPPITRSFSFNKATELAKELPRPLAQSPVARSSLIEPNTVLSKEKVSKYEMPRHSVTTSSHLLQTNTIKKSLLPSFSGNKPSVLSYRLTRPTLTKHPLTVFPGTVQKEAELSENVQDTTKIAENSSEPSSNIESIETTPNETSFEAKEAEGSLGPSLEDMSLSSSSSVEHNDTSEEYMDDFDNLGNGGETLLLPVLNEGLDHLGLCKDDSALITKCNEESSVTSLHTFLSETVDWAGMGLTACKDDFEHESLSPVGHFPHGSSLDLSPSDSSGGTYMWDEEGMEALGGSGHPCGSFDSDLNSMDILNNLENVESCDLEEDDLMLDLDLSEDASLHSDTDGTSPYECSEKDGWPTQRRRRQQYWGRHNQFRCENRSGILQSFDGRKEQGLERSRSNHVTLDELSMKHMAQDCSSVKEQLLQLKTLLQMETDGSVEDTLEAHTPESNDQSLLDQKVVLLLKEVQELRNELRSKDRMITELSQQLSSPIEDMQCHCLQGSEADKESPEHQDKDTQTLWKAHNLQIPQTPKFLPNKLHNYEGLSRPTSSEAPCDGLDAEPGHNPLTPQSCSPDLQCPITVESTPNCAVSTVTIFADSSAASSSRTFQSTDPTELGLMSSQLKINEPASPPVSASFCCKLERGIQKFPLKRSSFSTLQPQTYVKTATTLIKPQEVQRVSMFTGALGRFGAPGLSRTRHQPLSAPGLPCINPARETTMHSTTSPIFNQQNQGCRQSLLLRKIQSSLPRASAPLQPKHSRLPKPKTLSSLPNPAAQQGQTTTSPALPSRMLPQF